MIDECFSGSHCAYWEPVDRWFDSAVTGFVIDPSRDCPITDDVGQSDFGATDAVEVDTNEGNFIIFLQKKLISMHF